MTRLAHLIAAALAATACTPREAETDAPAACLAADLDAGTIAPGAYLIGEPARNREEGPARTVETDGFSISATEVTNAQFARFVDATGYVTVAERTPDPADHPGVDPDLLVPGSAVFGVNVEQGGFWWRFAPGASWRAPYGPGSHIEGREALPVVHVAYEDAAAYAAWAGGRLPTEEEWEIAARGGLEGADYVWGDDFRPDGTWRANTWQGPFPVIDTGDDGHQGLAPVGCYEPNGYGLYDMAGNVWEWTASPFDASDAAGTIRGGSFLCAPNYCARFRPAARQPQEWDFSASHVGFRVITGDGEP